MMLPVQFPNTYIAISICFVAAIWDFKRGIIPNFLTVGAIVLGISVSFFQRGWEGAGISVLSALSTAVVPLLLFRFNVMGGGDVKLFAAIGSLLGVEIGLQILMVSFWIGALVGICMWIRQGVFWGKMKSALAKVVPLRLVAPSLSKEALEPTYLRFGPAICIACITVQCSQWIGGW